LLQSAGQTHALELIGSYSRNNGGTAPGVADFTMAGVQNVDAGNLGAILSALATPAVAIAQASSTPAADIQTVVNAYTRILAEATGGLPDATPGQSPDSAAYSAIGASTAAALSPSGLSLLGSVIGKLKPSDINTVARIEALALAVQKVLDTAAGQSVGLSLNDLQMLGLNASGMMVLVAAWYRLGTTRPSTMSTTRAALAGKGSMVMLIRPLGDGLGPTRIGAWVGAAGAVVSSS
jgi:hypothetical protein